MHNKLKHALLTRGIVPTTEPIDPNLTKEAFIAPLIAGLAGGVGGNMLGGMGAAALGAGGIGANLAGVGGGLLGSGLLSGILNKLRGKKKPVALTNALAGGIAGSAGSLGAINQLGAGAAIPGQLGAALPQQATMGNYGQLMKALAPYLAKLTGG